MVYMLWLTWPVIMWMRLPPSFSSSRFHCAWAAA